jgi:hypothetical protein
MEMAITQQSLGHFDIPLDVADLLLGFCVGRPADQILDPGCGEGILLQRARAWLAWLAVTKADLAEEPLWGIEFDGEAAQKAREGLPQARIIHQNYFTREPASLPHFDAIIGNPPYAPAKFIGRLHTSKPHQLPLFPQDEDLLPASDKMQLVSQKLVQSLGGRAGLHAYYFLQSVQFLKEGGRLGFVVPNGWLDVAYGVELKQFLLDHFRILAIVESNVERWLPNASVNTCLVILEKCGVLQRRTGNIVRLIRLKKPLQQLLSPAPGNDQRFIVVEQVVGRLMAAQAHESAEYGVYIMEQGSLRAEGKWGKALRAPAVYRGHRQHIDLHTLQRWATVQRGYTTGANEFFYLDEEMIAEWSIEPTFVRPLLKSLRGIKRLRLNAADCSHYLLLVRPESDLTGTSVAEYIKWGEEQGFHQRQTCAARHTWYELPVQAAAPLVLPKGIWQRHLAPLLEDEIAVDQQLYQILPDQSISLEAAAALLNSAWFALQIELHGRVNLGRGLLWLAAYELSEVRLPDPRRLNSSQVERLEASFREVASNYMVNGEYDLNLPDRQILDETVFDILGFSGSERTAVLDSLLERLDSRRQRATSVYHE